jgi:MazG family protein
MEAMQKLLAVMARLRDRQTGCPWDLQQTFATIVPHTLEEAYEVADVIERGDLAELKDELGDLLFQVVFYARLAEEQELFCFDDIVEAVVGKLIRRHPHVFGDAPYTSHAELSLAWERIKTEERQAKGKSAVGSVLEGIPLALPALTRAAKLQKKAAGVGFDWVDLGPVSDKIHEELEELRAEVQRDTSPERLLEEIGDVLFACTNLARHLKVDPEAALRGTNAKFERRFRRIETWLAESGRTPQQSSLEEMDTLWERAKGEEKRAEG